MIEIMRFQSKRLDKIDIVLLEIIMGINFVLFGKYAMVKADTVPDAQQMLNQNATTTMSGVSRSNTIMPVAASSESITHSGVNGTANWDIDSDGRLTVHAGHLAYGQGNWVPYANLITSVYVEPGVTPYSSAMTGDTNNGVFSNLINVETIDVTNFDVSRNNAFSNMFSGDSKLTNIVGLDTWNTSSSRYMTSMFDGCSSLVTLDVSSFDTSNVISMDKMFQNVSGKIIGLDGFNVSKVEKFDSLFEGVDFNKTNSDDIKDWDVSNVTNMSSLFKGTKFDTLNLSNWNFKNVTNMAYMFKGSTGNISQIKNISEWDTSKVSDMSGMFQNITTNDLSCLKNWNVQNVEGMGWMFAESPNLESLDLSEWKTDNLNAVSNIFRNSKLLNENNLKGYQNLVTNKVTNIDWMFGGTSFEVIDLSKYDTSNVTSMSGLFQSNSKLKKIIGNFDTSSVKDMSAMFSSVGEVDFSQLNIADWDTSKVEKINSMFNNAKIIDYDFLKNWNTSSVTDLSNTFSNISSESLPIDNWNVSKVNRMYMTFYNSTNLKNLSLGNWDVSNVTNMSGIFWNSGAKSLDIKNWNTSNVTIFYAMFNTMSNLETLDLSNLDTTSATDVQYMFGGDEKLWKITLGPKSVLVNLNGPANPVWAGMGTPVPGTIISDPNSDGTYKAISNRWQEVAPEEGGTDHAPVGDLMSNKNIVDKFSTVGNPVTTYVWQQQPQIDMKMSVPDIDFGETYDSAGLVKRNAPFAINVTNNSYPTDAIPAKINVSMDHPLTDVDDTSKTLNDVLVFKGQDNIEKILSSADTEIYNGDIANGSNDLSWDDDHGILLDMNNDRYAKNGHYTTTLKWTLTNSI